MWLSIVLSRLVSLCLGLSQHWGTKDLPISSIIAVSSNGLAVLYTSSIEKSTVFAASRASLEDKFAIVDSFSFDFLHPKCKDEGVSEFLCVGSDEDAISASRILIGPHAVTVTSTVLSPVPPLPAEYTCQMTSWISYTTDEASGIVVAQGFCSPSDCLLTTTTVHCFQNGTEAVTQATHPARFPGAHALIVHPLAPDLILMSINGLKGGTLALFRAEESSAGPQFTSSIDSLQILVSGDDAFFAHKMDATPLDPDCALAQSVGAGGVQRAFYVVVSAPCSRSAEYPSGRIMHCVLTVGDTVDHVLLGSEAHTGSLQVGGTVTVTSELITIATGFGNDDDIGMVYLSRVVSREAYESAHGHPHPSGSELPFVVEEVVGQSVGPGNFRGFGHASAYADVPSLLGAPKFHLALSAPDALEGVVRVGGFIMMSLCPDGSYPQPSGECGPCPAGERCYLYIVTTCPPGYTSTEGQTQCQPCALPTDYTADHQSCLPCPRHMVQTSDRTACEECPRGFVCDGTPSARALKPSEDVGALLRHLRKSYWIGVLLLLCGLTFVCSVLLSSSSGRDLLKKVTSEANYPLAVVLYFD